MEKGWLSQRNSTSKAACGAHHIGFNLADLTINQSQFRDVHCQANQIVH